jgi:hypothetical protein
MGYEESDGPSIIDLITKPWPPTDEAKITIYYLGELKVYPEEATLNVGQTVSFEVKGNFDAWVTLPEGVLIDNGNPPPQLGPQSFGLVSNTPRDFTVADAEVEMDYFVYAKFQDGKIEAVKRPPVIIIKKVSS